MSLVTLLLVSTAIAAPDTPGHSALKEVSAGLARIAEDLKPEATVVGSNGTVVLSYKTRKFLVHGTYRDGRRVEKAHEAVGPQIDGLIVRVSLQDGRYAGAAVIPQDLRKPYWTTFINAYPVAQGKQYLWVNISFGSRTEADTITRVKQLFESVVNDDPDVRSRNDVEAPAANGAASKVGPKPVRVNLTVARVADSDERGEFVFVIGGVAAFKTMAGLKDHIDDLPEGSTLMWSPSCVRRGPEPLDSDAALKDLLDFCKSHGIKFVLIPAG